MEKLRIGTLAKHALMLPGLRELRSSAVERIVKLSPHKDGKWKDWDAFCEYVESRLRTSKKVVAWGGPAITSHAHTNALRRMLADRSVTVPLDSLIAPLRDVYTDLPFANPYEELVDQPKFSEDYLNARGELLDSIFDGWKRPLLVTYNGSEFLDLRSVLSRTDGFMIVWTPTPKDLLEDALLLAATWHEYDRDDFIQRFGRALVHTIRGWLLLLERMSGFYGRFAIAAQFTESSDGDFVIPLTLDSFRGAVLAALSPDCYADIAIDASPRNVWSRQIENLEAL